MMLVLSRDVGGRLVLLVPPSKEPTRIEVILLDKGCRGQHARLGIEAPRDVRIVRKELLERAEAKDPGPEGNPGPVSGQDAAP